MPHKMILFSFEIKVTHFDFWGTVCVMEITLQSKIITALYLIANNYYYYYYGIRTHGVASKFTGLT